MFKNILPYNTSFTNAFRALKFSETLPSGVKGLADTKTAQIASSKISSFSSLVGAGVQSAKEAYHTTSFTSMTEGAKAQVVGAAGKVMVTITSGVGSITHSGYKVYQVGSFLWNWGPYLALLGVGGYLSWQCFISYRNSHRQVPINVHIHTDGRDLTITRNGNNLSITHHNH